MTKDSEAQDKQPDVFTDGNEAGNTLDQPRSLPEVAKTQEVMQDSADNDIVRRIESSASNAEVGDVVAEEAVSTGQIESSSPDSMEVKSGAADVEAKPDFFSVASKFISQNVAQLKNSAQGEHPKPEGEETPSHPSKNKDKTILEGEGDSKPEAPVKSGLINLTENDRKALELINSFLNSDLNKESSLCTSWKEDMEKIREKLRQIPKAINSLASTSDEYEGTRLLNLVQGSLSVDFELRPISHLVLVVHGIGKHDDFISHDRSWNGQSGDLSGGLFDFKQQFHQVFSNFPGLNLEYSFPGSFHFETIEWHQKLRESFEVERVLKDHLAPDGVKQLREFLTETVLDGFMYMSSVFSQAILDNVAASLNEKVSTFKHRHPGFQGTISVFAHSLGSLIVLDLLTGKSFHPELNIPKLDFKVNVVFLCGSPASYFRLLRGDLFDKNGRFDLNRATEDSQLLPGGTRVLNFVHPLDAISWKMSPLVKNDRQVDKTIEESALLSMNDIESKWTLFDLLTHLLGFFSLVKSDKIKPAATSEAFKSLNDEDLGEVCELINAKFEEWLTVENRTLDFLIPTSRYEKMTEMAYAMSWHSVYWNNPSITLHIILSFLEPLLPLVLSFSMLKGLSERILNPLKESLEVRKLSHTPVVRYKSIPINLKNKAGFKSRVYLIDSSTGFQRQMYLYLQDISIYLYHKPIEALVGEKIEEYDLVKTQQYMVRFLPENGETLSYIIHKLRGKKIPEKPEQSAASRIFEIVPLGVLEDEALIANNRPSRSGSKGNLDQGTTVSTEKGAKIVGKLQFRVEDEKKAYEWVQGLNLIRETASFSFAREEKSRLKSSLFELLCSGIIERRTPPNSIGWRSWQTFFGTISRRTGKLSLFKNAPDLLQTISGDLSSMSSVYKWDELLRIRFMFENGTSLRLRFDSGDKPRFDRLVKFIREEEVRNGREFLRDELGIEKNMNIVAGHELVYDNDARKPNKNAYAVFLIYFSESDVERFLHSRHADFETSSQQQTSAGKVLKKRYKQFQSLHADMTKELEGNESIKVPPLPSTSLVASIDDGYLNKKCIMLNGFLRELSESEQFTATAAWIRFIGI